MGRTVAVTEVGVAEATGAESVEVAAAFRALGANVGVVVQFQACVGRLAALAPFSVGILS